MYENFGESSLQKYLVGSARRLQNSYELDYEGLLSPVRCTGPGWITAEDLYPGLRIGDCDTKYGTMYGPYTVVSEIYEVDGKRKVDLDDNGRIEHAFLSDMGLEPYQPTGLWNSRHYIVVVD